MNVVVVGGGLSGLFAAHRLTQQERVARITVLEARRQVGGRIRTKYDALGRPQYEEGAWRIPATHTHMLQLCAALGLVMQEVESEGSDALKAWIDKKELPPPRQPCQPSASTLSLWDNLCDEYGVRAAQVASAQTGYAGMDAMAQGSNAYGVENMTGGFGAINEPKYFVPSAGMSAICLGLRSLLEPRAEVLTSTRVRDLTARSGQYHLSAVRRLEDDTFQAREFIADVVILACPPSALEQWPSFSPFVQPVLEALESVPLFKCFCRRAAAFRRATNLPPHFHLKSDTLSQQLISGAYPDSDYVELAYSAGRRAEGLEHMRLGQTLACHLQKEFADLLQPGCHTAAVTALIAEEQLEPCYWQHAVHIWKPSFNLDVPSKSREACLLPSAHFPRVFFCGEAYSALQGWGEGGLQTALDVVRCVGELRKPGDAIQRPDLLRQAWARHIVTIAGLPVTLHETVPRSLMAVEDRLLDVRVWAAVHPGSAAAIRNHLGEDASDFFQANLHPRYVQGLLFALQRGWLLPRV